MSVVLLPYTVLLLRPDWQHDGVASDWVSRQHVHALDPQSASEVAIAQLTAVDHSVDKSDLDVLAVFDGHVRDVYNPYEGINP